MKVVDEALMAEFRRGRCEYRGAGVKHGGGMTCHHVHTRATGRLEHANGRFVMTFVGIWNSSDSLAEVCQRTGKTQRQCVQLASAHRASGKELKFFPRPGAKVALPGQRFGKWTVVEAGGSRRVCVCDCGTIRTVFAGSLMSGASLSCGDGECRGVRRYLPDAKSRKPEYKTWVGMRLRCKYPATNGYENYGGRGIRVCERWDNSFEAFLQDMGPKPTPRHTIERKDHDGNYEPGNCCWASPNEQANNTRANRILVIRGRSQTLAQWSEEVGVKSATISARLNDGWSQEDAVFTPVDAAKRNRRAHARS